MKSNESIIISCKKWIGDEPNSNLKHDEDNYSTQLGKIIKKYMDEHRNEVCDKAWICLELAAIAQRKDEGK